MEVLISSSRVTRRMLLCFLVIVLVVMEPVFLNAAAGKTITEAQLSDLHAALVLKIAMFVNWPDDAPDLSNEKISLGIIGDDDLYHSFELLKNKKIKGQEIELVHHLEYGSLQDSRILFCSRDQSIDIQPWPGVLTIGDSPDFNARGGMIRLSIENGRSRFTINLEAAEAVGIEFSSKLLKIAKIYKGDIQ